MPVEWARRLWTSEILVIASMEGANESGRRAVDAPLQESGSSAPPCQAFDRYMPPEWDTFRQLDDRRYAAGQPNLFDVDLTLDQIKTLLSQRIG